ncbi:MAG: METTL5 family protein [Methanomicrobiales archaeon]|nr:METTL5 family protein [Methanomicrobiales archaeon]
MRLRQLEMALERLEGFPHPSPALEQYRTPAVLAARLLHHAWSRGDIAGKAILDLGCGTGILACGAMLAGASRALGVDVDTAALAIAEENARHLEVAVTFLQADIADHGKIAGDGPYDTAVMNPPFGAQKPHADRPFIDAALAHAPVVYGIFNVGSILFLESYVSGRAEITDVVKARLPLRRTFRFHRDEVREIPVEIARMVRC